MPSIAGEAAVRIVPSVRGFHSEVKRKLEQKRVDFDVNIGADMGRAYAKAEAFRKAQESRDVKIRVVTDFAGLKRDLAQVEHIFKRNSMSKAIRLNVVVAGLDLLPVLAYGAAGAAASIDTLARSALVLPGALGGALASVGTLATGLHGVKAAFTSYTQTQKKTAETARIIVDDNRQLQRSYRDYGNAVRDTIRDIQDLNAENRRSSLNVADAILGVQEAADRLRQGGQKTILELRRDQLSYLQAVDRLQEVNTKAKRVAEDTAEANAKGVQGADKVADALDQINKNIEKLNTDKLSKIDEAMAKLSPNAQAFVTATRGLKDEWGKLQNTVQDNLFRDLDKQIVTLANNTFPMLERGMGRVATSLNGSFKSLAAELGNKSNTNLMERIFGNTDVGIQRLSVGFKPFVDGMLRLTKESSDFLPRLGEAGAKVAQRFDNWVNRISNNGKLDEWISKGLDGFSSLGRTIGNLGGALTAFTSIFDNATGNKGGFLSFLERKSDELKKFLEAPKGQNALRDYFKETKQFIGELKNAYQDIKPLIKDVVDTARDWSLMLFKGIGVFASLATSLEKHTGLLKPLLTLYFGAKTVKPIWDILSTSYKNYERLVIAGSNNAALKNIPGIQTAANMAYAARGQVNPNAPAAQATAAAAVASAPAFTPGGPVNAKNIQKQAALRGVGTYSNPLLQYNYLVANGLMPAAGAVPPVEKGTYAQAPLYGPMQPAPEYPPNSRLSKKQRAAKAEALAAYREKASQFYDFEGKASLRGATQSAPALGPVQGPELPPIDFDALGNKAKDAAKSVDELGKTADAAKGKVDDLGKKTSSAATASENFGNKAKGAKPEAKGLGDAADTAATKVSSVGTAASKAATETTNLGTAAKNTAKGGLKDVSDAAKAAGDDVGDDRIGLKGRLVGLASSIGIQAAISLAVISFTALINKLGEAHREAADAAKAQEDRLKNLAGTLDQVTGGYTAQTYARALEDSKAYTPGGGVKGTFNLPEIIARLGINGEQLYKNALDPTKGMAFQQDMTAIYAQAKKEVLASPVYQKNAANLDEYDLDIDTVTRAALGDTAALQKFRNVFDNEAQTEGGQPILPDLGAIINAMPNKDYYALGHYLNTSNQAVNAAGYGIVSANMTMGRAKLTPAGSNLFGPYGADSTAMFIDPGTRNGVFYINREPSKEKLDEWSSQGISVSTEGNGRWKVTIDPSAAGNFLERYATGGMVRGPGGPTSDSILARVSAGEHITNAAAVQYYGADLFHALNSMSVPRFAPGGWPFPLKPVRDPHPDIVPATPAPAAPPPPPGPLPAEAGGNKPAAPAAPAEKPAADPNSPFLAGATAAAPTPLTPFLPGSNLPASRAGDESGLQVNTIGIKRTIETLFPQIQNIGGFRQDNIADHPSGRAIDVMIPNWDTPQGKAYGDSIAAWLRQYGAQMGVDSFIWQDTWNPINESGTAHRLNRQGANEGHYNHIHIKTNGGGYPSGSEQYKMPAVGGNAMLAQALSSGGLGGIASLLQALPGGGLLGGITSDLLTSNSVTGDTKKDPTTEFLSNIASSGGANLLSIGTSFLSGITGIDFSTIVGTGQKIANGAIDAWGPKKNGDNTSQSPQAGFLNSILPGLGGLLGGANPTDGSSPGTDVTGQIINGIVGGDQNPAGAAASTGFDQSLTGAPTSENAGESSGPVTKNDISAAVDQLAPMLGIKNKSAWVDALYRASNGKAKVFETGSANYGNGQQKALAALMTAVRDWGIDPTTGGPKNPSYAMGGSAGHGLAWLSNGEFRTNPTATRYYGAGLFNALNAKAIPRDVARRMIPRFDSGGLFGNPGGGGMSDKEKLTMSQLLFLYGKNNLTASDRQHMTPQVQSLKEQVAQQFNAEIGQINGWRPPDVTPYGTFTEHSSGQALDVWLNGAIRQSDGQMLPPADPTIGNRVRDFMLGRGADYVLWNQTEFDKGGGQSRMAERDGTPTMLHTNHDHGRVKPGTQIAQPPSVARDLNGLLLPAYADGGWWNNTLNFGKGIWDGGADLIRGLDTAAKNPIGTLQGMAPLVGLGGAGSPGVGESWKNLGKSAIAYDEWTGGQKAHAAGRNVFDLATTLLTGGSGAALKGGTKVASVGANAAGKIAEKAVAKPAVSLSRDAPYLEHNIPLDPSNYYRSLSVPATDNTVEAVRNLFDPAGVMSGRGTGIDTEKLSFAKGAPLDQYTNGSNPANMIIEGNGQLPISTNDLSKAAKRSGGKYVFSDPLNLADVDNGTTPLRIWMRQFTEGNAVQDNHLWQMVYDSMPKKANGGWISGPGSGTSDSILARVSNGEYIVNAASAQKHLGLLNAINFNKVPGFAGGGLPIPDPLLNPPAAGGQSAGPLPLQPPAPLPPAPDVPVPDVSVGAQQDTVPVPSTGGEPGPGATAPAPDPGSLPGVADALAGIGGLTQPGAAPSDPGDPRGVLGAAPQSQEHTNPALSGLISGAASAVGSIASLAAKGAIAGGTMGGGAALAMAPGVSQGMDAGIQAGAQMAGAVVNGAVNILSSFLVGTATNGSTASASGIPLLPQRQDMQTGVPAMGQQYQDNRTYNITNMDEYRRLQERDAAQAANPFIGKF